MIRIHVLVALGAVVAVSACGQKGPLLLPDAARAHKKTTLPRAKPPTSTPAPAATPGTSPGATPATESSASPSGGTAPDPAPSQP